MRRKTASVKKRLEYIGTSQEWREAAFRSRGGHAEQEAAVAYVTAAFCIADDSKVLRFRARHGGGQIPVGPGKRVLLERKM